MKTPKLVEVIDLPQRRCININTIRYNLIHLMYVLSQHKRYEEANLVADRTMQLMSDSLKGKPEKFHTY